MSVAAAGVTVTRSAMVRSKEAEGFGAVAHQQVLRLLIVIQHHSVGLATDPGLLVPAECRVSRIEVIAIGPHSPSLDLAAQPVRGGSIPSPDAGAQSVERVVGQGDRLLGSAE